MNDGRRFPGLYRLRPGAAAVSRETSRYGGSGLTVGHGVAIFDQLELSRGAGLESDLYGLDTKSGRVRRLTRGARVVDPDLSPDGRRLAVSRTGPGFRELLVLDADALLRGGTSQPPVVLARAGGPSDVYVSPRWSPDGRRLAVEHRRVGGRSEIVVFDDQLRDVSTTLTSSSGRNVTPEWAGDDVLYFSSDRDGGTFAIWKAVLATGDVTRVIAPPGGALAPARLRDQLVYLGYTADGYDLFTASPDGDRPAPRASAGPAIDRGLLPHLPPPADGPGATPAAPASSAATPYRPWGTFAPRGWLPVVEQRDNRWWLGGSVQAIDVLGRHAAWVTASWAVAGDHPASDLVPAGRPDWSAGYQYARWQLSPYVIAQDQVSLFEAVDQTGSLLPVAQREQQVDAGALRTMSRVRWVQQVTAAYHASRVTTTVAAGEEEVRRSGLRGSWTLGTARQFAYSISQERGVQIGATAEAFRPALGADGSANAFTGDVRVFAPIGIRQGVLAARLAAGWSSGDVGIRRVFRMGGNNGDAAIGSFGNQTISLLRGFDSGVFAGTHVALANLEARLPLAWPQRGWGTWPLFLKSLHATAFADAGNAWSAGGSWSEVKTSVGAELSTDVVAGFGLPLTWTVGAAWGHDGAGLLPDQHRVYVRVGRAF